MSAAAPRVSFIVTGYKQEHLIDEAIEGALAQDWPNLQIILSDDCSPDGTFARMKAAAARYRGPHRLVVHRLERNQGTFGNIYEAFGKADGELIVLAGGDDISYPHRTRTLVERWQATGAAAFQSRYDVIDESGELIAANWKAEQSKLWLLDYFPGWTAEALHGASIACHRSVLERLPPPTVRIRFEDTYLTLMLGLERSRCEFIDEPLVRYRKHSGAISNEVPPQPDRRSIAERERTQMAAADSQWRLLDLFRGELARRGPVAGVEPLLADDIALFRLRARWEGSSLGERLQLLPAARRRRHLRWLLPRLGGFAPFVTAKAAAARLSRRGNGVAQRTRSDE